MQVYPLFPLQIVVFPHEDLNLHIFEPRYIELIGDCKENGLKFGIPTFRKGYKLDYGTLVELTKIEKTYPDGRMDIRTKGIEVLRVKKYLNKIPEKLYPGGELALIKMDVEADEDKCERIRDLLMELYSFMNIKVKPKALEKDIFYSTEVAHKAGFNFNQEYHFLQLFTEYERQEYLLDHLQTLIPVAKNMEEMRKKIQLNGHFKDILPPKV
ncbi:MAG: LON peptidase substrate-binding domain-containing protein [Saprospiraceae bacterium]